MWLGQHRDTFSNHLGEASKSGPIEWEYDGNVGGFHCDLAYLGTSRWRMEDGGEVVGRGNHKLHYQTSEEAYLRQGLRLDSWIPLMQHLGS